MPKEIDDKIWEQVREAYLAGGETYASLALRFGIGKSTIEAKASSDKWKDLKKANTIATPLSVSIPRPAPQQPRGKIDEVEIVESAILLLSSDLYSGNSAPDKTANALIRLLQFRREILPPTAAHLADVAIALNISPQEFIRALSDKWQQRA